MYFKRFYLGCLSHASYLIGDAGTAVLVDPQRDIDHYVEEARDAGLTIDRVILTHFHADFTAGHLEARERFGAEIYLGRRAQADFAFRAVHDGDELRLGQVRLRFLETPGHTPEGISIVIHDEARDADAPWAVLTGDTLFVGDVGRPDLMASVGYTAEELAGEMFDSLHDKLLTLPDETRVYPAHGAGSMCGKSLGPEAYSTIGEQKRDNYALQPMTRAQFIAIVTADQPAAPAYFSFNARLNREERDTLASTIARALRPLDWDEFLTERGRGAQVLDTRDADAFAAGHVADSLHIGLSGNFASWCGTLLSLDAPIVIVAHPGEELEAATRLGRIGFDHVAGFLRGGIAAAAGRPELVTSAVRVEPHEVSARTKQTAARFHVLDVRTPGEFAEGHIPGALNIPLQQLAARLDEVPRDRPLIIACRTGYRSSIAGSLLRRWGVHAIEDMAGGMVCWPVETAAA